MKKILIFLGVILVAAALWYLMGSDAAPEMADGTPTPTETPTEIASPTASPTEMVSPTAMPDEAMGDPSSADESDADSDASVKEFVLTASNYEYDVSEIRVNEGDTVRIVLQNIEGYHDWVVDEFDASTDQIRQGGEAVVEFVADQKGTFEYYCSVGNHRAMGMVGTLVVE